MKRLKWIMIVDDICGWILMVAIYPFVKWSAILINRVHLSRSKNLFVLKMMGGGSLIIAYPTLYSLRKTYPDVPFTIVTTPAVKPFACALGLFDRILVIDNRNLCALLISTISALWRCVKADTIIDLEVYSRLASVLTGLTMAKIRIGFFVKDRFLRSGIYTHLVYFDPNKGTYDLYDEILKLLRCPLAAIENARAHFLKINITNGISREGSKQIGIGPACSNFASERMLSALQWKTVLSSRLVNNPDTRFFILGGPSDYRLAENIIQSIKQSFPSLRVENLCGLPTLNDTIKKIAELDEFWTIDSALNHVARLLGVKILSFWGPTDPKLRLRVFPGLTEKVYYKKIYCSPCVHVHRTPPCNSNNVCLSQFFSDQNPNLLKS